MKKPVVKNTKRVSTKPSVQASSTGPRDEKDKEKSVLIKVAIITGIFALVTAIIGAIAVIVAAVIESYNPQTQVANAGITQTIPPPSGPSATPVPCPYEGIDDRETIANLIRAEADATNKKSTAIIDAIFDPKAEFYDFDDIKSREEGQPRKWIGPAARYENDLFRNTNLRGVGHFDITPVGPEIDGNIAYFVSGSEGEYKSGSEWKPFNNPSVIGEKATKFGSDHWILKKNSNGCWVIVRFEFNAGHIEFPYP